MSIGFIVSCLTAYFQNVVSLVGLLILVIFVILNYIYFNLKHLPVFLKSTLFFVIFLLTAGFVLHDIPGFNNYLLFKNVYISNLSTSFSAYLNFDKVAAGVILYTTSSLSIKERYIDKKSMFQTFKILFTCCVVILLPAVLSGYVKFDFKIPNILVLWVMNQLLFISMSEEVIFRGFLQNNLESFFKQKSYNFKYNSLIIASIIFGLSHYKSGIIFIALAIITGLFYGYAYIKTKRIFCAILVHFGLNFAHFLLFTYPALRIH